MHHNPRFPVYLNFLTPPSPASLGFILPNHSPTPKIHQSKLEARHPLEPLACAISGITTNLDTTSATFPGAMS